MKKTILIEEDIHQMLFEKRDELQKKYKIEISAVSIVETILRYSIPTYDIINNVNKE